jgi:hypothetical protein
VGGSAAGGVVDKASGGRQILVAAPCGLRDGLRQSGRGYGPAEAGPYPGLGARVSGEAPGDSGDLSTVRRLSAVDLRRPLNRKTGDRL